MTAESQERQSSPPAPAEAPPIAPAPSSSEGEGCRWIALMLVLVVLSVVLVVGGAALGAYRGLQERFAASQEAAEVHYQQGLRHRQAGELELARAEFEEALRLQPGLERALDQLRQLRELVPAPTAIVVAAPTRSRGDVETLLTEAQALYGSRQWQEAARRLETIRALDPAFQPDVLSELLFGAYLSAAQELEAAGKDNEARTFYEKALALRADNSLAQAGRDRLQLYAAILLYWGVDWEQAVQALERLYKLEPGYRDVRTRLAQALAAAGDVYRQRSDWCLAADRYSRSVGVVADATIKRKADEATNRCYQPTPTPRPRPTTPTSQTPVPAGTPGLTPGATPPAADAPSGRILFARHDPARKLHQILMVPARGGTPTPVAEMASQPAVSPDGLSLAFHSWESDRLGLLIAPLVGGDRRKPMKTTYLEDMHPSWSPDGKRLLFSSNRHGDRKWRVYLTWVDGQEEAKELLFGEAANWSRTTGRIVYRGCGARCEVWGLYTTDETGAEPKLLLADPSATAPTWSPDGRSVAFMSNRDGNWELYLVGGDGLGLRRLTNGAEHDGVPAWSPDGQWIAFLSHRTGAWGLYALPVQPGRSLRLVYLVPGEYPDWMQEQLAWIP